MDEYSRAICFRKHGTVSTQSHPKVTLELIMKYCRWDRF